MILLINAKGEEFPDMDINKNSLTLEQVVELNIHYVYTDRHEL